MEVEHGLLGDKPVIFQAPIFHFHHGRKGKRIPKYLAGPTLVGNEGSWIHPQIYQAVKVEGASFPFISYVTGRARQLLLNNPGFIS